MRSVKFCAAALLVVAGVVAVSYLRGDRRQIRLQLDALADTASVAGTESDVTRLARAARISGFFTEDVVIRRSEDNSAFVGGRRAVAGWAAQAAAEHQTMKVSIENLEIAIADSSNATADMTVVVSRNTPAVESVDLREVAAAFRKVNGAWLIAQAEVRPSREGQ
jgi:hypothetical protein